MKYIILETTDNKFVGLEIENPIIGEKISLGDFLFEVDNYKQTDGLVFLSNANYVMILKEGL